MNTSAALQPSDLPKSFDLKKYEACATFSAAEWYNNLKVRGLQRSTATDHREYFLDGLRGGADHILMYPILAPRELKEGDGGYLKTVSRSQVRDQTAFELLTGNWVIDDYGDSAHQYRDAFAIVDRETYGEAKYDDAATRAYDALEVPAWKMLNDVGIGIFGSVAVNVDLFASEEKLVDDFRAWLRVTREALNIPTIQRRFARTDFGRWYQNRILAYLDLSFWADINGYRLTNQVLGIALFPDEYNVGLADRIRKVVAPLALAASSPAYVEALQSQALEKSGMKIGWIFVPASQGAHAMSGLST